MHLTEILDRYSVDYEINNRGWAHVECWNCSNGKRHMGIHTGSLRVVCWVCGRQKLVNTIYHLCNVEKSTAQQLVKSLSPNRDIDLDVVETGRYQEPFTTFPLNRFQRHVKYLKRRGFSPKNIAKTWGVRSIGPLSDYCWRLFIPIYFQGKPASWTTRDVMGGNLRYWSAKRSEERICHKDLLYGFDMIKNFMVICEGPTDAWRIGRGAVCTFGLNYSQSQLNLMTQVPKRIVCFDKSDEAQNEADRLCRYLSAFEGQTINYCLENAEDPGSADKSEIKSIRALLD